MIKTIAKGVIIGIANIIPGISGGTLAVVLGIYDTLIQSINALVPNPFKNKRALFFIIQIVIGAFIGIKLFAGIIDYCLTHYLEMTHFFFIGLILGSIPVVVKNHKKMTPTFLNVVSLLATFILLVALTLHPGSDEALITTAFNPLAPMSILYLIGSGIVAAASMIIPGISGSFILLVMGSYSLILNAIRVNDLIVLGLVAIGGIIGLVLCTRIISYLLKHHPGKTHYAIIGLLLGSVIKLYPGISLTLEGIIAIVLAYVGFLLAKRLG